LREQRSLPRTLPEACPPEEDLTRFKKPHINTIDRNNLVKNEIDEEEQKFTYFNKIAGIPDKNQNYGVIKVKEIWGKH
jgi:hypothetical protein